MSDISSAKMAIEEKRYNDAIQICSSLVDNGPHTTEFFSVFAQSLLLGMASPYNEEIKKAIFQSIELGADAAKTVEELCELQFGIDSAYYRWHEERIRADLNELERSPTLETWESYFRKDIPYTTFKINCRVVLCATANYRKIKAENEDFDEILHKYDEATIDTFPDEAQKTLEYGTGLRIFRAAQKFLENNNNLNVSAIQSIVAPILARLTVAELIINYSIPKENNEIAVERLKTQAECISYSLNAVVYPNGQAVSLAHGSYRTNGIDNLKKIYSRIKSIEPDFCAPSLPSAEAIQPQRQDSGGCYIATAVYGSYDCPEVWTLRRYRDNILAETWYGRAFIYVYYALSPSLVRWFGRKKWFKSLWKPRLDNMVKRLNEAGVIGKPYRDKT